LEKEAKLSSLFVKGTKLTTRKTSENQTTKTNAKRSRTLWSNTGQGTGILNKGKIGKVKVEVNVNLGWVVNRRSCLGLITLFRKEKVFSCSSSRIHEKSREISKQVSGRKGMGLRRSSKRLWVVVDEGGG
jgi:hypothetical protein